MIEVSHLFFAYFAFNEELVTFYTCWKVNFFFVFALDFSHWLIFFIALDRLLASKHPQFYKFMNRKYYIGGIVTFCLAFCTAFKFITYRSLTNELTLCTIGQAVTGVTERIWIGCVTTINCGVVVVYFALRKLLKNVTISDYRQINRSLITIIAVDLCGWLLACFGCGVAFLLSANTRVFTTFEMPLGTLANMNLAAPFFIYYSRSTLYRKEFKKLLGFRKGNVVAA